MSGPISAVIFAVFVLLLLVGMSSTAVRYLRYRRRSIRPPVLLKRDVALLGGLAVPFVIIAAVRAFALQPFVTAEGDPHIWYLLVTGIPPIIGLAIYCWYELVIIERPRA